MRGEQPVNRPRGRVEPGSSPRARGADRSKSAERAGPGIIPACAGSSRGVENLRTWRWDHPRVRGEQAAASGHLGRGTGSSPRARGAGDVAGHDPAVGGIIPACAGSSSVVRRCGRVRGDHPRVRGEQSPRPSRSTGYQGSSPRARGAACWRVTTALHGGIIPACAGSSCGRWRPSSRVRDHPRVRGEQRSPQRMKTCLTGSSPRARGAGRPRRVRHRRPGIIPACAGSSCRASCRGCPRRDHPRVRGEQTD